MAFMAWTRTYHSAYFFFFEIFIEWKYIMQIIFKGEFDYPDPSQWTNAELGIPPDSFEEWNWYS